MMKLERQSAIRDVIAERPVTNQDELRRCLRRRGIQVTQATLSRDIHDLRLSKGPSGYAFPNGSTNGNGSALHDDEPPTAEEMLYQFGLRARQALNQIVVNTVMGGAQPVAAALDRARWPSVLGTIAGDDTVLIICADAKHAGETQLKLSGMIEA